MKLSTRLLAILFALSMAVAFSGCKGAQKRSDAESLSGGGGSISESDINQDLADSDSGKAMGLETVRFDFDASTLTGEAKSTLEHNTEILKDHSNLKVQIEGHCDERGGIQYNIALGERRAKAVKNYLTDKGIAAGRLTVISYGKEKPIDQGHDEDAWAKNRRANFRITDK